MIVLSPERRRDLVAAIAEGFDPDSLERRVLYPLGTSWKELSGSGSYPVRIEALIDWAQKEQRTFSLFRSLLEANPNSLLLRMLIEPSGLLPVTEDVFEQISGAVPPNGKRAWQLGLAEAARQVCVVEMNDHDHHSHGTGFLVGPDQIMTHSRVLGRRAADVTEAVAKGLITALFDRTAHSEKSYRILPKPVFVSDGAIVLQLDGMAGRDTSPDTTSASSGRARGWISPARVARPNTAIAIVQYVDAVSPRVSVDADGLLSDDGTIIRYKNSTITGSMGAPCFDVLWNLVGIHIGSDGPTRNQGLSIDSILDQLRRKNLAWDASSGIHRDAALAVGATGTVTTSAAATAGRLARSRLDDVVRNFELPDLDDDPDDDVWGDANGNASDADRWAWAEAAAVTAYFEPDKLVPDGRPKLEARVAVLLNSSPVRRADGTTNWMLSQTVRSRALERLASRGALEEARLRNSGDPSEVLDEVLGQFIAGARPTHADLQNPDRLRAMLQVASWLAKTSKVPVSDVELRASLERATLISPFHHLTQGFFAGRKIELEELLAYVAAPDSSPTGNPQPPLMIYGPGGMGKSALLSHFILANSERDTTDAASWLPFVYLDFDKPELDARDRVGVLLAIARQIGPQVPAIQPAARRLIEKWAVRRRAARPVEIGQVRTRQARLENRASEADVEELTKDLAELLDTVHRAAPHPLLLILDTLEEVQYATPDAVVPLAQMVVNLHTRAPFLRPVLSGRVEIGPPVKLTLRKLGPLPEDAAEALLGNHLPPVLAAKTDLVTRMIQVVGGNPLSLRLAAQVLSAETETNLEGMEEQELWERVGDAIVQGHLYERVVGHLHDGPVKKLAIPGLILRYITPRLIRDVLAQPCGIELKDDASAQALFDELAKEIALVRQGGDAGRLVLKPELRRTILDNFRRDSRSSKKRIRIHQAAVCFFAAGSGLEDRAEEIYHRLWLDEEPEKIDARWLQGVEISLRNAVEELEGRARIFLANRVGGADDETVARTASVAEWEVYAEKRASDLLKLDSSSAALDLLNIRKDRLPTSRLHLIESIAKRSLPQADLEGAEAAAEKAVAAARASFDPGELKSALQELVQVKRMRNDTAGVLRTLVELGDLGEQLGDDLVLLQANVEGLESTAPNEQTGEFLNDSTLRVFGRFPDELVARAPELARRVAAQIGGNNPSTLARVLKIVGVGPMNQTAAEDLQTVLAAWSEKRPEIRSFVPTGNANAQQLASALQYILANHGLDQDVAYELSEWLRRLVTPRL